MANIDGKRIFVRSIKPLPNGQLFAPAGRSFLSAWPSCKRSRLPLLKLCYTSSIQQVQLATVAQQALGRLPCPGAACQAAQMTSTAAYINHTGDISAGSEGGLKVNSGVSSDLCGEWALFFRESVFFCLSGGHSWLQGRSQTSTQ